MIGEKYFLHFFAELDHQIFRGQWRKLRHFNSYHQFEQFSKWKHETKKTIFQNAQNCIVEDRFLKNVVTILERTPRIRGAPRGATGK